MLRTHRAGIGPGDCQGWSLGSRNRRGPGMPPTPGLRGLGTSPGRPALFLGLSGWDNHPPLLSHSFQRTPPTCLGWTPLGLLPMPPGPMWPGEGGGAWRAGDRPASSAGSAGLSGWGKRPPLLSHSSQLAPSTCLSWSPRPQCQDTTL